MIEAVQLHGSDVEQLDRELWRQLINISHTKSHNAIRAASKKNKSGLNAWKALKEVSDRESLILLESMRSKLLDKPEAAKKIEQIPEKLNECP